MVRPRGPRIFDRMARSNVKDDKTSHHNHPEPRVSRSEDLQRTFPGSLRSKQFQPHTWASPKPRRPESPPAEQNHRWSQVIPPHTGLTFAALWDPEEGMVTFSGPQLEFVDRDTRSIDSPSTAYDNQSQVLTIDRFGLPTPANSAIIALDAQTRPFSFACEALMDVDTHMDAFLQPGAKTPSRSSPAPVQIQLSPAEGECMLNAHHRKPPVEAPPARPSTRRPYFVQLPSSERDNTRNANRRKPTKEASRLSSQTPFHVQLHPPEGDRVRNAPRRKPPPHVRDLDWSAVDLSDPRLLAPPRAPFMNNHMGAAVPSGTSSRRQAIAAQQAAERREFADEGFFEGKHNSEDIPDDTVMVELNISSAFSTTTTSTSNYVEVTDPCKDDDDDASSSSSAWSALKAPDEYRQIANLERERRRRLQKRRGPNGSAPASPTEVLARTKYNYASQPPASSKKSEGPVCRAVKGGLGVINKYRKHVEVEDERWVSVDVKHVVTQRVLFESV